MSEFSTLATPLAADISLTSPLAELRQLDGMFAAGAHYAIGTCNIGLLTLVAAAMIAAYEMRRSPGSILNIHQFHGKASPWAVQDTAFGRRDYHLMIEMIEVGKPLCDWTTTATKMLAPHASPSGYPKLLGPGDENRTAAAYGPNAPRLLDIKDRFDPKGGFRATALPNRNDTA